MPHISEHHTQSIIDTLDQARQPTGWSRSRTFKTCLDIRFRMLHPRELAAAMGFPPDYEIIGNKTDTTKQIGNAVPVNLATALCKQVLIGNEPSLHTFTVAEDATADD